MLSWGTTTAEAKSGYGLELVAELKQLRALARAAREHPVEVVATLLAAHETPPEYRQDPDRYIDIVCSEIVPAAAAEGLARYCDVFSKTNRSSGAQQHGGLPVEFPVITLHESFAHPTSMYLRNLMAIDTEEMIRGAAGGCGGADRWLRQDGAGAADGCGQRQRAGDHAGDRADDHR